MVKMGKPKASFDKAVEEIENYMSNPDVSFQNICINNRNIFIYF